MRSVRTLAGAAAFLPCLAALLLLAPGAMAFEASVPSSPYSAVDTGSMAVVLPSALPAVNLDQEHNATVAASLTLVKIVELSGATNSSTTPSVVAAAFESRVQSFNATAAPGGITVASLRANLTVYRDFGLLFPLANSDTPLHPLVPIAPTTLTVTVDLTAARSVVNVSATVANWPWRSSSDLLAVGWDFGVTNVSGFAGCSGALASDLSAAPCGSSAFAYGNSTWGWSGFDGVQGLVGGAPTAQLRWGPTAQLAGGSSVPLTSGAQRTSTDGLQVVYGAPAEGAAQVTFGLSYALALPTLAPLLLHGSPLPYLAGGLGAIAIALGAVVVSRRRDRKLLDVL